ncbi:anhydro-N-acetylmuramic acid kinase [Rhodovulum sulfidophilum]|uniref:Anhydro-N-acetylmuramic acid kinase n=1 Tax=Rhodovulum visakhapatnamense TaxID=364297 RepID=A0ABS1RES4_9RHOB|nr:anhydro-N-acetylmuramic acid kinase [Rhodovulum visakhapatnamense]MBL3568812.1 anhydro-N-acetylmuramic acid kinase [Rhodovulum visakhapatnamense]MBL3578139.1 anhydro-N-acetylmuramic acid kinase [Rhodovulum visakhapatnamense]OLS44434.1 anhydro-N-acetylmuramic acid kinase [Rhodovulum sulfidophilum]
MIDSGTVRVLGTMSGTSLDGVDAALIETDGKTVFGFGPSAYRPYSPEERAVLAAALGGWPGDPGVAEAAAVVEAAHAEVMGRIPGADLAGVHGQTLAHDPGGRGTHQAGDGAALARALGLPVVWDFRSADVAAGGQGAPLAPFYHFACARRAGLTAPVAFLNLGGVGNLTWVDPGRARPEDEGALLAFDTGPANAPIDDLMRARLDRSCDHDGALAAGGRVEEAVLAWLLEQPYFRAPPPKSLDRNAFSGLMDRVAGLNDADAAATLAAVVAASVAAGIALCPVRPARLLVTGGGRRNPVLMRMISARTGLSVEPVEALGLDGDMLEAQAFAYLAVRVARGLPTSCPGTTGVDRPVSGGRISMP